MTLSFRRPWVWLGLGLGIVYLRGLFIDVMDVDASQYASMAMEMLRTGHWLELQHHGAAYLDKPPLLFWTAALSFAAFGVHNWSYKLPSLFAALAGVLAVYRFSRLYYARETARNAAFIFASAVGLILIANDVRTDTLLLGMTACATWQLAEYLHGDRRRLRHLVLAGVFAGLAMLAKGPIGAVAPAFAMGTDLVLHRRWRRLFDARWLIAALVAAVLLLPMCWGLYQQFDRHPGQVFNGQTIDSGLYFYFWQQSFGRITGASSWKNGASGFYFFHVYLWAFLPWSLLFIGALWRRFADLMRTRFRLADGDEAWSIGGFVLTFAALSLSHYKLPHYVFITLPWAAILTARWLEHVPARGWWRGQYLVFGLLTVVLVLLLTVVFPTRNPVLWGTVVAFLAALVAIWWQTSSSLHSGSTIVVAGVLAAVATGIILDGHFYPELLRYQGTSVVPRMAVAAGIPLDALASYHQSGDALDVYAGHIVPALDSPAAVDSLSRARGPIWLYTDSTGRVRLDSAGVAYAQALLFHHFPVSRLTGRFLNRATRSTALVPVYLLRIPATR